MDTPAHAGQRRVGFLTGEIRVPADFDRIGQEEIENLFTMAH